MHKVMSLLMVLFYPIILWSKAERYDSILAVADKEISSDRFDSQKVERLLRLSNTLSDVKSAEAIRIGEAALSLSKQIGYTSGEIDALCNLGTSYSLSQQYEACLKSFAKAIKLAHDKLPTKLPDVYNHYGNVLSYIGNYREAAEKYYKAIEAIDRLPDPKHIQGKLLKIYYNLYSMWRYLGNYEQGMVYLNKAEEIALIEKDSPMLSRIYAMKGTEYLQENPDDAKAYLYQALDLENSRKQITDIDNRTVIYTYLGYYYINMQKEDSADLFIGEILKLFPQIQNPYARIICLLSIGEMHFWMQRFDTAIRYLHTGLRDADQQNMQYYKQRTYEALGTLYQELENFDSAYHYQQLSYQIKNELTNETQVREISFLEHQHQLIQSERQLAEQHLRNATLGKTIARRNGWIVLSCFLASGLIAIFFVVKRHRRRKLRLQQEQISALIREMELEQLEMEIKAKEAERKRVAMELHDGIGSLLYVARLNINALSKAGPSHAGFTAASELVNHTIKDLRGYSHSLFPEMLLQNGLEPALRAVWKQYITNGHLLIQSYGEPKQTSTAWNKAVFRVLHQLSEPVHGETAAIPNLTQLNWHQDMLFVLAEWHSYPAAADSAEWEDVRALVTHFGGNLEFDTPDAESLAVNLEFPYSL